MDSRELSGWLALFAVQREEAQLARDIAEGGGEMPVYSGGDDDDEEDDEDAESD